MDKIITIRDYAGKKQKITIKNFKSVIRIDVEVISGDEKLSVFYKNGDKNVFDSSDDRMMDFYDNEYCIYNYAKKIDLIDKFSKRESSYDELV